MQLATYASPEFAITLYWHPSPYIIKGAVMRVPLHHIVWCRTLNSSLCIAICPCVLLEICGRHMYHGCSIRACHVSPYHHGQHVLQCIVIAGELLLFIYGRVSHMGIFRNILLCRIGWANHVVYPWPKSRYSVRSKVFWRVRFFSKLADRFEPPCAGLVRGLVRGLCGQFGSNWPFMVSKRGQEQSA